MVVLAKNGVWLDAFLTEVDFRNNKNYNFSWLQGRIEDHCSFNNNLFSANLILVVTLLLVDHTLSGMTKETNFYQISSLFLKKFVQKSR